MLWTSHSGGEFLKSANVQGAMLISFSFAILHGPTQAERPLMEGWIQNFVAFVQDDQEYDFGTETIGEMKVATPQASIEIQKDGRWEELLKLGEVFADDRT